MCFQKDDPHAPFICWSKDHGPEPDPRPLALAATLLVILNETELKCGEVDIASSLVLHVIAFVTFLVLCVCNVWRQRSVVRGYSWSWSWCAQDPFLPMLDALKVLFVLTGASTYLGEYLKDKVLYLSSFKTHHFICTRINWRKYSNFNDSKCIGFSNV